VPKVLFSVSHPELAMQADGWDPTGPSPRSNEKLGWQCHLGHTWQASSLHSRREMITVKLRVPTGSDPPFETGEDPDAQRVAALEENHHCTQTGTPCSYVLTSDAGGEEPSRG